MNIFLLAEAKELSSKMLEDLRSCKEHSMRVNIKKTQGRRYSESDRMT